MAITVNGPGGAIDATSSPATVAITADTVALNNGIQIRADTHGAAPAGDITFNVGTLTTQPGTNFVPLNPGNPSSQTAAVVIASDSTGLDAGAGHAGRITLQGSLARVARRRASTS